MPPTLDTSHQELFAAATKLYEDLKDTAQKLDDAAKRLALVEDENQRLRDAVRLANARKFGRSSEASAAEAAAAGQQALALEPAPEHESIFNEAEVTAAPEQPEPSVAEVTGSDLTGSDSASAAGVRRNKRQGKRQVQLQDLPRVDVHHDLPLDQQVCSCCQDKLQRAGEEVHEKVKTVPASSVVERHIHAKYACRNCARRCKSAHLTLADERVHAFPGSLASPSVVALIVSQKYELGLPLYRLEKYFAGHNLSLSRQTLSNWVLRGMEMLKPFFMHLRCELLRREIAHADETPVQVLREHEKPATSTSYMWVYRSGRDGPPLVLYDYQPDRSAQRPLLFLAGFRGYLHADGYVAYEKLPGVTLVGCWAHARRKFHEALQAMRVGLRSRAGASRAGAESLAHAGLKYCNALFAIESHYRDATPEVRLAARRERSQPILDEMHAWLTAQVRLVTPKSATGTAISYCLRQWSKLTAFIQDGRLELDNNRCERAVKPFVIGRKNWLFANTPRGATASAIAYSLVESAKANGLNPTAYLEHLFTQMATHTKHTPVDLDALLPWAQNVQTTCR